MREIWVAILLTVVIVGGVLSFPWAEKYGPPAAAVPAPAGGPSPLQRDTNVAQRTAAPEVPAGRPDISATPEPPAPAASTSHGHSAAPAQSVAQAPAGGGQQQSTPAAAAPDGDPQAGRLVYRKCQACHSLEPGKNTLGPSLAGIIGKKAASDPNFDYSPALKAADITWNAATIDSYLRDPQKTVPGNKMPFPGLKTENERKDVIAYLAAATSSQPRAVGRRRLPRAHSRKRRRRRRLVRGRNCRHKRARRAARRLRRGLRSITSPTSAIRCAPASPKVAWCSSASAARSTDR